MPRILIVDDEPDLCEILSFNLAGAGYDVLAVHSGEEALDVVHSGQRYDLLLLDVMMERMSGFDVARRLRGEGNNVPIIFLTALANDDSQLEGFESGADDYIYKPFTSATVLARVAAVLRRTATSSPETTLVDGSLSVNPAEQMATIDGQRLQLTKKEYLILLMLLRGKGQHFSREQIMATVWGDEVCVGDRSVDVHIARLRRKLGTMGAHIVNRSGFGYAYE